MDDVLFNQCLYPEGCVGNCKAGATSSSYSVFPLWSSGFQTRVSCEACGFGALHAVFLKENRTRGRVQCSVQEIRVSGLALQMIVNDPMLP